VRFLFLRPKQAARVSGSWLPHAEFFGDVVNADAVEVEMLLFLALAVRAMELAKVADVLLDCAFFE
jgi:hypothetical protein